MNAPQTDPEKYPIGKFKAPASYTQQQMRQWIEDIKSLPGKMRIAVMALNEKQLDTPYRLGGWTIRQVVHHVADSHSNAITRFKLALTENNPTIKPYEEADWALLADSRLPVESSLRMLEGIHIRWVALLESLTEEQWDRAFIHPELETAMSLKKSLGLYAWHGNHHLAHITKVKF